MKIMTIRAKVDGTLYKDRQWVTDDTDPQEWKEAWLTLLAAKAGTVDEGSLIFAVARLVADEPAVNNQLNEALNRRN